MILVFAGAGASTAVNPESYPTTVEFFERLPKEVTSNPLFNETLAFLRQDEPDKTIDIEDVLSALSDIGTSMGQIANTDTIGGWLFAPQRNNQLLTKHDRSPFLNGARHLDNLSQQLTSLINSQVYNLYHREPDPKDIKRTWGPLLNLVCSSDEQVEIVTTNYDLVLETVIDVEGLAFETGRTKNVLPILNNRAWKMGSDDLRAAGFRGRLTKLHGSVDWTRNDEVIHVGNPMFRGKHEEHVILYPGFKTSLPSEPFLMFHKFLARVVSGASMVIFIGFAFRDDRINQILRENIQRNTTVAIVDPVEIQLPFSVTGVTRTNHGFDDTTAKRLQSMLPALVRN